MMSCRCVSSSLKLTKLKLFLRSSPFKTTPISRLFSSDQVKSTEEATLEISDYLLYKLDTGPPKEAKCTAEEARNYLNTMITIRIMENACANLYKEKKIRGFCHLYAGQEAVAVGIEAALKPGDAMLTSYRCHGMMVTRGAPVVNVIAELTGREIGVSKGKGGSMHMYYENFYGGNGIVGSQIPIGVGIALAMKHKKKENVCVDVYGDGAANQGQAFESFNMAMLWKLPVIFLCENNKYALGTSDKRSTVNVAYYTRASYIPGLWVNGMDLLAVREGIKFARDWVISGKGPIVVEAETYRYFGHSMSDPGTSYRTRDEVDVVRKQSDPISMFTQKVINAGLCTDDEAKAINKRVRAEVAKDREQAETAPEPDVKTTYDHVMNQPIKGVKIRGCDAMSWT